MRKKLLTNAIALAISFSTLFSVASCGGGGSSDKGNSGGGSASGMISVDPLSAKELGEGFNEAYLPDASAIKQRTGRIDVCLDFEGTQEGWKALEKEYERLHGGGVDVKIDTNYSGSQYSETLNYELENKDTEWDIVEGNLGYGSTRNHCIDMRNAINSYNPYCGEDTLWTEALLPAAYKTKEADTSNESYILNTEVMQTCWFINDVAFQAAVEKGYTNAEGRAKYPVTWNDLILLCEKMEEAGYSNPLGITLCNASIESLQFTWLLRVYGDYYYRQFYKYIMAGSTDTVWEEYDPTETVVETNYGYGHKFAKLLNMMFEENCSFGEGYVGLTSEVYRDFVSQIAKVKGHLMQNVATVEFGELRDQFETQSSGKSSPQIMLDYQGFGIKYEKASDEDFEVGYFDYPQMISGEYKLGDKAGEPIVDPDTITRDIGGNGGFLSVINHLGDSAQNELNKDFVKFVMSPYGQTIYYKGLAEANAVPKGLSSVKNELVVIPSEWKTFFEESGETITFSGDVDANPFLGWGVRYGNGKDATQDVICEYWRNLLMTGLPASQTLTVSSFASKWDTAMRKDMVVIVAENKWPEEFWKNPNYNL
jgi:ABC-type glycerol-3-phosphate transport system substrate-binding protein